MTIGPPTVTPTGSGGSECSYDGQIQTYFNYTSDGVLGRYEGQFEICLGGYYGSVCDIGWDQLAAGAICRNQFGGNYGKRPSQLIATANLLHIMILHLPVDVVHLITYIRYHSIVSSLPSNACT